MHRNVWFPLIMLGLGLLLAACGDDLNESDAEAALRAAFEGEYEQANAVFCEDDQVSEVSHLPDGVVFMEVSCERQGGTHMECISTFKTPTNEEQQMTIVFRIQDDDKLCNPRLR